MATGSEQCCVLVFHFDLGGLLSTVRQDFFLCGKKTTVVRSLFSRSAAGACLPPPLLRKFFCRNGSQDSY